MTNGKLQSNAIVSGSVGSEKLHAASFKLNAVVALFVISAIIVWLPFKGISYILPLAITLLAIMISGSGRMAKRLILLTALYALIVTAWALFDPGFYIRGAILTFITYGGGVFLFVIYKWNNLNREHLVQRLAHIWCWILIIEGSIGFGQAIFGFMHDHSFDIANGDWVKGTIGLSLHGMTKGMNFSNAMFAANMAIGLLMAPVVKKRRIVRNSAMVIGGTALVMASVMHIILFLIASIALSVLILQWGRKVRSKKVLSALGAIGVTAALAGALLSANLRLVVPYAVHFIHMQSPKGIMVKRTFSDIPEQYPLQPIIGLGPGQFSSTGALIATGQYFGSPLHPDSIPGLPTHLTKAQRKFFYGQWMRQVTDRYFGSTQAPYFSWLSLYQEFGAIFLVLLFCIFTGWVIRAKKFSVRRPREFTLALSAGSMVIFLSLLGLQVNYWGVPQSSFLGFFTLAVLLANINPRIDKIP